MMSVLYTRSKFKTLSDQCYKKKQKHYNATELCYALQVMLMLAELYTYIMDNIQRSI